MIAKRERGKMERQLVASLTQACEQAKPLLPGFCWLTHQVDYTRFPDSLVVTWVFDTHANLANALKGHARRQQTGRHWPRLGPRDEPGRAYHREIGLSTPEQHAVHRER